VFQRLSALRVVGLAHGVSARAITGAALLVAVLSLGACHEDKKITAPPVGPYAPLTSASNVLLNLKTAYQSRDNDAYRRLFAPDFKFAFCPADVHDSDDPAPLSWGYLDEMACTADLFTDSLVDRIDLDYMEGSLERADSVAFGPGAYKMQVTDTLGLMMRNEAGEPLTFLVPGTSEVFYFRKTTDETTGDATWRIFRWEDQPMTGKEERTTWGRLKRRFRHTPPAGSDFLPQNSIHNVLANLKASYESREYSEYRKLFDADYRFHFNPVDTHGDHPTPESWGFIDEMASARNMFVDQFVEVIRLDFTLDIPERADSLTFGPNAWKVRMTESNLRVVTRDAQGDPLTLLVPGTTEVFYLRQSSTELVDGRLKWYVFRWDDQPVGKTQVRSWGQVKCLYR
jgi:hypothetical protein